MWSWILWAILLIIQNAAFTMVSRARNSGSLWYHAIAAVFSNGVWFASQILIFDKLASARESGSMIALTVALVFYTVNTVIGSLAMHHILQTYVEKGKRKVGA